MIRRWKFALIVIPVLLTSFVALLVAEADAARREVSVRGTFDLKLDNACNSPVNLCAKGRLKGTVRGPAELVVQSTAPTGTPGLSLVTSTFVVHTKDGDLFFASSATADLTGSGDGQFTSIDLVTGGTGKWAGSSGYLQSRGFVAGMSDAGDYRGRIVLR